MINLVTVKDIQPKNVRCDSNPNNQNKVRRAWVSMLPEHTQEAIKKKLPVAEVRFAYYKSIDDSVVEKWIAIMQKHYNDSVKAGAKIVLDRTSGERLEDAYCVDSNEHLIQAAEFVAYEIVEQFA